MIDGLIAGKLYGEATRRTGQSGKPFVTAKVRAAVSGGEAVFVNVITFSRSAGETLLALGDGDSVSLTGPLTPKAWTDQNGDVRPALDMVAHSVLTVYEVTRRRAKVKAANEPDYTDQCT